MATAFNKTAEEIQDWLVDNVSARLEMSIAEVDLDEPLTHMGLSSREAIMISGELEEWLGYELPPELLYEYPDIRGLAAKLAEGPDAFLSDQEHSYKSTPREGKDEMEYVSFIDMMKARVREIPDRIAYIFLRDGEKEAGRITVAELDRRARAIAAELQARNMEGKRAILIYPSGLDFITGFLGCFYAGVIAVPAYPPTKTRGMDRLKTIAQDCDAQLVMVTRDQLESILQNRKLSDDDFVYKMDTLATDEVPNELAEKWTEPALQQDSVAFLQYTSGSTGDPKGVMVTHGNILHNMRTMRQASESPENGHMVAWLPMFHDMGLIGHVLFPLDVGLTQVSMPPTAFLEKPIRWLRAISDYQATFSTAPNFAYDLCVEKIKEEDMEGLNLSSWVMACNGAEPVREETLERFAQRFKPYGFRRKTFFPTYGMAETTLMASAGLNSEEFKVCYLDGPSLENNKVVSADPTMEGTISKIGCGRPINGKLLIVDPETFQKLGENKVGEIWFQGGSVTKGYWNKPDVTDLTFHAFTSDTNEGPFLRTGDLGFLQDKELYITGRLKDLIIIRGRNHYPQDIEETIQKAHPALTVNGGAAFTIDAFGEERLVVVQEVERTHVRNLDQEEVFDKIRAAVAEEHNIQVYAITLLSPGRLPRTTSGKIQRRASKKGFIDNTLMQVGQWKLELSSEEIEHAANRQETVVRITDLLALSQADRIPALQAYFQNLVAKTLKIPAMHVDVEKPVVNLGLDSMHAIEIKNQIETDFLFELPVTQFMEGISIQGLAILASEKIESFDLADVKDPEMKTSNGSAGVNLDEIDAEQARELLVDIDNLSPEEIEKLLEKLSEED